MRKPTTTRVALLSSSVVAAAFSNSDAAFAACSFDISKASMDGNISSVQLLPEGQFRAKDGRPEEVPFWHLTKAAGQKIIALIKSRPNKFIFDYEHN
ncbi:MAG: hypothetical protein OQJ80_04165, partial [Kangiella sp.]|nr:hypothetical protein [Kangiella sp.]